MPCNGDSTRLIGVFIYLVTSHGALPVLAIPLDNFDQIAIFQLVTSASLSRPTEKAVKLTNYVEKLEPQPQDLVEWGLMKLKAWRIRVSS
jgi:hypothetical protein